MDPQRAAWLAKYAKEREPWRGPVHAAPLLDELKGVILELGAGGGKVGAALPHDALAVDWAALPPGRPGVLADVRALPVRDASVDAVVAIHVLEHLASSDHRATVREWDRVLPRGGTIVLEVFARGDAREGDGREIEPGTFEREGIRTHYFDEAELRGILDAAAFEGTLVAEERQARWGRRRVLRGSFRAKA